jgi:hypothetical protein
MSTLFLKNLSNFFLPLYYIGDEKKGGKKGKHKITVLSIYKNKYFISIL